MLHRLCERGWLTQSFDNLNAWVYWLKHCLHFSLFFMNLKYRNLSLSSWWTCDRSPWFNGGRPMCSRTQFTSFILLCISLISTAIYHVVFCLYMDGTTEIFTKFTGVWDIQYKCNNKQVFTIYKQMFLKSIVLIKKSHIKKNIKQLYH